MQAFPSCFTELLSGMSEDARADGGDEDDPELLQVEVTVQCSGQYVPGAMRILKVPLERREGGQVLSALGRLGVSRRSTASQVHKLGGAAACYRQA
jgi:hypothetical protein